MLTQPQVTSALAQNFKEMTMDNVTFIKDEQGVEHAIIDHGNEQFTSMTKAEYDRQQVEHLTEIPTE
jgi:hypothetical protein